MPYTRRRATPTAYHGPVDPTAPGWNRTVQRGRPVILSTGRGDVRLTLAEADDLARQLVAACAAARRAGAADG